MQCVRASRMVGIPKPDGGVRPIAVSKFFLKLIGSMALKSGRSRLEPWQYCESGNIAGAKTIVHKCRKLLEEGYTLCKFDLRNAYNEMPRALCALAVVSANSPSLKRYFTTTYLRVSDAVIYGPGGYTTIQMREGVRQGDATSSYIFCKALDIILKEIVTEWTAMDPTFNGHDHLFCYMDDLTFAIRHVESVDRLATLVTNTFRKYTMTVNLDSDKSCAITNDTIPSSRTSAYKIHSIDGKFDLLGASLSQHVGPYFQQQKEKQTAFFNHLVSVDLHPALLFTILRMCARPRLIYVCGVMRPDEHMQQLTEWFDAQLRLIINGPGLLNGRLRENDIDMLYVPQGLGLTAYAEEYWQIYAETAAAAGVPVRGLYPQPATNESNSAGYSYEVKGTRTSGGPHVGHQWMYFTGKEGDLTAPEYRAALCHRMGILDERPQWPVTCDCGTHIADDDTFISHTLSCPKGQMTANTGVSYSTRHNLIRDNALVAVPRAYGITCTSEPVFYRFMYEDDESNSRRPDVTYRTWPPVAIDLSIVYPGETPGTKAADMAARKEYKHKQAVEKFGHRFAPFVMETTGYLHHNALEMISVLAAHLPPWMAPFFRHEMMRTLSVTLQRQKTLAIKMAVHKYRNQAARLAIVGVPGT